MRIDLSLQPIGPERMMQRLQELQAGIGATPAFQLLGGESGMAGNIPGNPLAPFNPTAGSATLRADGPSPDLKLLIDKAANENGVDPALLDALVAAESSYDPNCLSRAKAMGLTQLLPETAKEMGITKPFDPEQNLQGGARYLARLLAKYPGRLDLALAAYNAGPNNVAKHGGIPPYTETQNYVKRVLGLYDLKKSQP